MSVDDGLTELKARRSTFQPANSTVFSDGTNWHGADGPTGADVVATSTTPTAVIEALLAAGYTYVFVNTRNAPGGTATWVVTNGNLATSANAMGTGNTIVSDGGLILQPPNIATQKLIFPNGTTVEKFSVQDLDFSGAGLATNLPRYIGKLENFSGVGQNSGVARGGDGTIHYSGPFMTGTVGAVENRMAVFLNRNSAAGDAVYGSNVGCATGAAIVRLVNGNASDTTNTRGMIIQNQTSGATAWALQLTAMAGSTAPTLYFNPQANVNSISIDLTVASGGVDTTTDFLYNTGAKTTGQIFSVLHSTSTFSGHVFLVNMASGSGTFSGNFINFQKNAVQQFRVVNTGIVAVYAALATAALGLRVILLDAVSSTQTAGITVFTFTPPAVAGTYFVTVTITTTSATNTGTIGLQLTWVDALGTTHTNDVIGIMGAAGTVLQTATGASLEFSGTKKITIDASATAIILSTTTSGSVSYRVGHTLERSR